MVSNNPIESNPWTNLANDVPEPAALYISSRILSEESLAMSGASSFAASNVFGSIENPVLDANLIILRILRASSVNLLRGSPTALIIWFLISSIPPK